MRARSTGGYDWTDPDDRAAAPSGEPQYTPGGLRYPTTEELNGGPLRTDLPMVRPPAPVPAAGLREDLRIKRVTVASDGGPSIHFDRLTNDELAALLDSGEQGGLGVPDDRAELWEKFTAGEKLAYGCGYRDAGRQGGLDVEHLADVLTELHLRWDKGCSESHLNDARWVAARLSGGDSDG